MKQRIQGKVKKLHQLRTSDLGLFMFGGFDRIARLQRHFKRMLHNSSNNIDILIFSHNKQITSIALQRIGLNQYFDDKHIIQCDHDDDDDDILFKIKQLCLKYDLKDESILYIDHDIETINFIKQHHNYETLHIYSSLNNSLTGLSLKHMLKIERLVGIDINNNDYDVIYCHEITTNLKSKDNIKEYHRIRLGIKSQLPHQNVLKMPILYWIRYNWPQSIRKNDFINFSLKMNSIEHHCHGKSWTLLNILPELMRIDPQNVYLKRRYGRALTYLAHNDNMKNLAEKYLKMTLSQNCYYIWNNLDFAIFLFKNNRLKEAEYYYRRAQSSLIDNNHDIFLQQRIYIGLARTLQWMQKYDKSEYYYRLSTKLDPKYYYFGINSYYHFGKFLFCRHRYKESKYYFEKQIQCKNYHQTREIAGHYYQYSKSLLKLGEYEKYQIQLIKALQIDPYMINAKQDLNIYNYKCLTKILNQNNNNILMEISIYIIQFDTFWFDRIGIINKKFNTYYDYFVFNQTNDIRYILFETNIKSKLQNVLGIKDKTDLEIIMINVIKIRNEHKQFIKALKQKNLNGKYKLFSKMFHLFGIFTAQSFKQSIQSSKDLENMISKYSLFNTVNNNY